jgi:hypothetical protein
MDALQGEVPLGVDGEKANANGRTKGLLHPGEGVPYVATLYGTTKDVITLINTGNTMLAATKGNIITH